MQTFSASDWFQRLFNEGEDHFTEPPEWPSDESEILSILSGAHATESLHLPGAEIPFVAETAIAAAQLTLMACWFYLNMPEETNSHQLLPTMNSPKSPADHLSADLTFRYLAGVYQRSFVRGKDHRLTIELQHLLRNWPLSGVLTDLREPPSSDLNFCDSATLQFLYAERLTRFPRAAWMPIEGLARQRVELVFHRFGKLPPVPTVETT